MNQNHSNKEVTNLIFFVTNVVTTQLFKHALIVSDFTVYHISKLQKLWRKYSRLAHYSESKIMNSKFRTDY